MEIFQALPVAPLLTSLIKRIDRLGTFFSYIIGGEHTALDISAAVEVDDIVSRLALAEIEYRLSLTRPGIVKSIVHKIYAVVVVIAAKEAYRLLLEDARCAAYLKDLDREFSL